MKDFNRQREKRILSRGSLVGYRSFGDGISEFNGTASSPETGQFLGIYENQRDDAILVGLKALVILKDSQHTLIPYESIVSVTTVFDNKYEADTIKLGLAGGQEVLIYCRKGNGRFRDVFEFCRFLKNVNPSKTDTL